MLAITFKAAPQIVEHMKRMVLLPWPVSLASWIESDNLYEFVFLDRGFDSMCRLCKVM